MFKRKLVFFLDLKLFKGFLFMDDSVSAEAHNYCIWMHMHVSVSVVNKYQMWCSQFHRGNGKTCTKEKFTADLVLLKSPWTHFKSRVVFLLNCEPTQNLTSSLYLTILPISWSNSMKAWYAWSSITRPGDMRDMLDLALQDLVIM